MGVAVGVLPHQTHVIQQLVDPLALLLLGGEPGVEVQSLPDDIHDRHSGVQGSVGVLEDHLDPLPVGEQLGSGQVADVVPVIDDLSVGGLIEPGDGAAQGTLAAARLSHQAKGLVAQNVETDMVHRLDHLLLTAQKALGLIKILGQAVQLQQLIRRHGAWPPSAEHIPG